jgi:lipopolysaccharide/colanic/teichoic acid biosynthesis glycosyltransferase
MVADAEQRLDEVAHLNPKEIVTKIPNDPRLTPVGKWLRGFSIDEILQLVNVLRGDMSVDFESWMHLDLQCIDNWSLGLDVRIILMTIPQVLSGRAS